MSKQIIFEQTELSNKPKSERHKLADRFAEFIIKNGLTQPYGGDVTLSLKGRPHYCVLFCYPRTLDGQIAVYSHNFIVIQYQTGYRNLPSDDRRVYTSEADAMKFLDLAFVQHKADEALAIPVKEKK